MQEEGRGNRGEGGKKGRKRQRRRKLPPPPPSGAAAFLPHAYFPICCAGNMGWSVPQPRPESSGQRPEGTSAPCPRGATAEARAVMSVGPCQAPALNTADCSDPRSMAQSTSLLSPEKWTAESRTVESHKTLRENQRRQEEWKAIEKGL